MLITNESKDTNITLYIYHASAPLCTISTTSKIITPSQKYLHRHETEFKFKLVARFEDGRGKKTLLGPQKWVEDKLIKVTESLDLVQESLAQFPEDKRLCLRKIYREKELRHTCGGLNLYEILGLDMDEVRTMKNPDKQKQVIKKAFREKMRIWHPDKNFGDQEIAMQIVMAREILLDDERRVRYHNEADYDEGWLSFKRFKAIFWPECFTEEQNKDYWKRIGMLALSLGLTSGGIILTACTTGAAAPATVVCGAVFGFGLSGAGLQSLMETVKKDSVAYGCKFISWLKKAGIGFVGGAVTGGAASGITAGVVGIGSAALESGAVTAGQYVGIGAATGAVGGVTSSLASDAGSSLVDGVQVTMRQLVGHAVGGAVVGATAGVLGGLATQGIANHQASAAAANFQGELAEKAMALTGAKPLGDALERELSRKLTHTGTEAIMGTAGQFVEERLDNSVENQHPMNHVKRVIKNVPGKVAASVAAVGADAIVSHVIEEVQGIRNMHDRQTVGRDERDGRVTCSKDNNNEDRIDYSKCEGSAGYEPIETDESSSKISHAVDAIGIDSEDEEPKENHGRLKFLSEGTFDSKMIVTYVMNGEEKKKEVCKNEKSVKIPAAATQIEVKFQVWHMKWDDVMKYDRFKGKWCSPKKPHIFRYEKPHTRTFTISGILGWRSVVRVSNEYHEETFEM